MEKQLESLNDTQTQEPSDAETEEEVEEVLPLKEVSPSDEASTAETSSEEDVDYDGPERRVHTIFRTQNREYHVKGDTCVAVRDPATRIWISNHEAIGSKMDIKLPGEFFVGRRLLLSSPYYQIKTSTVLGFERPERQTVDTYDLVWAVCPV